MSDFDWKSLLERWSAALLASSSADHLPADVRASGWLGFHPATEKEIEEVERRLKIPLPPSYRAFLLVSNGWRCTIHAIERLRPANELRWFREKNRDWVTAYAQTGYGFGEQPTPDADYFSYENPESVLNICARRCRSATSATLRSTC
jgi:hypothetical protein